MSVCRYGCILIYLRLCLFARACVCVINVNKICVYVCISQLPMPRHEGIHEEEEDEEDEEDDEVLVNCSMNFGTAFCFVVSLSMVQDSFSHNHRCVCV